MSLSNGIKHFKTITRHKLAVGKLCFKVGLYRQGIMHDFSKYSPTEFRVGARYYQGTSSPNNEERKEKGYSEAWLHHKGRNKHHFEYWMDIPTDGRKDLRFVGKPMPARYVVEMFCDRVAACKIYQGDGYTQTSALNYLHAHSNYNGLMHPDSAAFLERMLTLLAEKGEKEALHTIKHDIVKTRHCEGDHARW